MFVVEQVRRELLQATAVIAALYRELQAVYRGWFEDAGSGVGDLPKISMFERRMAEHLYDKRALIRATVRTAVNSASESAPALAGGDFSSDTTQRARRDLEALVGDEIERRFVAQLQSDQATLVTRRHRERLQRADLGLFPGLNHDIEAQLYRLDSLGRRRRSIDYVTVETQSSLFGLTNTLTYALLLARGERICTLEFALEEPEPIRVEDFPKIQDSRLHPRSTALIRANTN